MKRRLGFVLPLALASLLAVASASMADSLVSVDDPRAAEALAVFAKACVIAKAAPKEIGAKMVEFQGTKLPDNAAVELAHGAAGSLGWKLDTPHGAHLLVSWKPPRQCSVLVKQADARSLQNGTVQVLEQIALGGEMRFRLEHHTEQPTKGGTAETSEFLLQIVGERDASVAVTTTASTEADLQGILVFKLLGAGN